MLILIFLIDLLQRWLIKNYTETDFEYTLLKKGSGYYLCLKNRLLQESATVANCLSGVICNFSADNLPLLDIIF